MIEDEQIGRGIRSLQRAAELERENAPLLAFVGEHSGMAKLDLRVITWVGLMSLRREIFASHFYSD